MNNCDTSVEFGENYQLFCKETEEDIFMNNAYNGFYINVYLDYPRFNYKRIFRFTYAILNILRFVRLIWCVEFQYTTLKDDSVPLVFICDYRKGVSLRDRYYSYRNR